MKDEMVRDEDVALDVNGLRMRYGATDVLHDVTLRARRGEVLALLGPNGAGKTTTIEILEGFRIRSAGRVSVLGTDPAHGDEQWRARLGVVLRSVRDIADLRVGRRARPRTARETADRRARARRIPHARRQGRAGRWRSAAIGVGRADPDR